ncbi:MAG TPA: hypothetical protein VKY92_24875, partial [Verrucomicrobiae bacterium]|nr:hypothetical protein [Verrucomicrobiae bacterium]
EPRLTWERIVAGLERLKGCPWEDFSQRYGDWGRDAALWLGRQRGRYTLGELGQLAGGLDYAAVGQAVSRFGKRLQKGGELQRQVKKLEQRLLEVEM